jgi:hypothetical protein
MLDKKRLASASEGCFPAALTFTKGSVEPGYCLDFEVSLAGIDGRLYTGKGQTLATILKAGFGNLSQAAKFEPQLAPSSPGCTWSLCQPAKPDC